MNDDDDDDGEIYLTVLALVMHGVKQGSGHPERNQ